MSLGLLELSGWRGSRKPTGHAAVASARPALENLEERTVMASPASLSHGIGALLGPVGHQAATFLPININNVVAQGVGDATQLVAFGTIAGQQFIAPITLGVTPVAPTAINPAPTPILNLHLGPIDLNVLGLQVKTSEICLNISAQPGPGNLLGNLLSGLANALNTPTGTLGGFLGSLTSGAVTDLRNGVTGLLDGALGALTDPANATVLPSSTTNILHLSVGPLNLNLLGLVVNLDNCDGGPVTVDVNAVPGSGNLLGNLLSSIAHLADRPNVPALDHLLANLGRSLNRLGR